MFFWLIILGFFVWYVFKQANPSSNDQETTSHAHTILDERFVKGEIDESTYQKMKHHLEEEKK